jgi:hypothetical protein
MLSGVVLLQKACDRNAQGLDTEYIPTDKDAIVVKSFDRLWLRSIRELSSLTNYVLWMNTTPSSASAAYGFPRSAL